MDHDLFIFTSNKCNDNGNFIQYNTTHGYCDCDIAYFKYDCSESGYSDWNNAWIFFQIAYTFCYVIIAGFTWLHLLRELLKVNKLYYHNRNMETFVSSFSALCKVRNTLLFLI